MKCSECNGRGWSIQRSIDIKEECPICKGSGKVKDDNVRLRVVDNEYHFVRFDDTDAKIIEASTLVEGYIKMLRELGWE